MSGEWHSVKEKLPEPPANCLCYSPEAHKAGKMMTGTYTEWGWMFPGYFPEPTHWMALPGAPGTTGTAGTAGPHPSAARTPSPRGKAYGADTFPEGERLTGRRGDGG